MDPDARKVLYRLHNHGFLAYLVGGSVRDLLLGKKPKDFDMGTDARPQQIRRLFKNSRIIGRRFRLVQVFFRGGKVIEVSTFRRASDEQNGEILQANNTFGSPTEDALRRDLTINALFYNIADFSVVDYVEGLKDLRAGLIRAVGDADIRFHRDPVRILRAIRHAARAGFKLTKDTLDAVRAHQGELALCPPSRIRDELMRDLKGGSAAAWLELAHQTGVLYSLFPTLEPHYSDPKSPARQKSVELMAKVDRQIASGKDPQEAIVTAALFWPALEALSPELEFAPGRAGNVLWTTFVREALPNLARPVAFPKRVIEQMCQITGMMGFVRRPQQDLRLPRKITQKGYFEYACRFAELLEYDLRSLAEQPQPVSRRRRRPRKRNRPKPEQTPK